MRRYDAILFDNDGVIVSPTDPEVFRTSIRDAFAEFGVTEPRERHVDALVENFSVEWIERVCGVYGIDPAEFWRRRETIDSARQQAKLREGQKTLYEDVQYVSSLPHDLGIVSTNHHSFIEFLLTYYDIEERFATYYGREPTFESLDRRKPSPYYLNRALDDLGTENALYVGDSQSDIEAAANAGIDSAFLRRSHVSEYTLSVQPTYEIDTLDALSSVRRGDVD